MTLRPVNNFLFALKSSIHIGGRCEAYFPESEYELLCLIDHFYQKRCPFKIVGRASNILASDHQIKTKIIFTERLSRKELIPNGVRLQSGVRMSREIYRFSKLGKNLLAQLIGVPGSVGGMIYQNASCFGREIAECFLRARVYDYVKQKIYIFSREQMAFGYRDSALKHQPLVLLDADFRFLSDVFEPMNIIRDVTKRRKKHAPEGPSLGSVFLKHEGISIGYLLDMLSQKGRRFGSIMVSMCHAGVLVNTGRGTQKEFKEAISALSNLIYSHYGFYPKEEIEYLE